MRLLRLLAVSLLPACATELSEHGSAPEAFDRGGSSASAGGGGGGGKSTGGSGSKSTANAGATGTSSAGGKGGSGGKSGSAGSVGEAGQSTAGTSASGGSSGSSSGGSGSPAGGSESGSGGAGDGVCDETSAQLLTAMQSLITLDSDACLKIEFNADQQEWVQSVTMQPNVATYPFPFSWSSCGTQGSGSFNANYGNQVLTPVDPSCPLLIQLSGPGQSIELQWWAS